MKPRIAQGPGKPWKWRTYWRTAGKLPALVRLRPVVSIRRRGGARLPLRISCGAVAAPLPDLDDRTVENDVCVALGQLPPFLDLVDLRVTRDQNGRCIRFPGQDRLRPEGRVVLLARLGAEDRQLATGGPVLYEIDLG